MTSTLTDPYRHIPTEDRYRIHSGISKEDGEFLFTQAFPYHGAMNRIVAQMVQKFAAACRNAGIPPLPMINNESVAQELLDSLTFNANITHDESGYI